MKAIYAVLILFLFSSCAKDGGGFLGMGEGGETTVEGKVTEKGSGKAVANAQVNLNSLPDGSTTALYRTDSTVYTDANGNYAFSFDADKDRTYEVQPKQELYNNIDSYKPVTSGRKNKIDLTLDPYAWVRVHIINEPPLDTLAYVHFSGFQNISMGVEGPYKDTILIGRILGNFQNSISIFWKKNELNAPVNKHPDQIYSPGLDTVDYYFKY